MTGAESYAWSVTGSAVITSGLGTNSIFVDYSCFDRTFTACTVSVYAVNACGTPMTRALRSFVTVSGSAPVTISGATSVNRTSFDIPYEITSFSEILSYEWSVTGGAVITSGLGTPSILVDYRCARLDIPGSAVPCTVRVTTVDLCGNTSYTYRVANVAVTTPGSIVGNTSVYRDSTNVRYYTNGGAPTATSYRWTVSGGATFTYGVTTDTIYVNYLCFDRGISSCAFTCVGLKECGGEDTVFTAARTLGTTVNASPARVITGLATVRRDSTNLTYSIPAVSGLTYFWTASGGARIISPPDSSYCRVDFRCFDLDNRTTTQTCVITVTTIDVCGYSLPTTYNVSVQATTPSTIVNNNSPAVTYPKRFMDAVKYCTRKTLMPAMDTLHWTVSGGATYTATEDSCIFVNMCNFTPVYGATSTITLTVEAEDTCGIYTAIQSRNFTVYTDSIVDVLPSASVNRLSAPVTYYTRAYPGASTYTWTCTGGGIDTTRTSPDTSKQ
jgi:hypothetical protein